MVYILNKNRKPLMPTMRHGKVRRLIRDGLAEVVKRTPFTVRLLYDTEDITQPVTLGIDAGYLHIGMSASTEKQEVFCAEVLSRNDVSKNLDARRQFRRGRRSRNIRHRKPRFENRIRSKHKGWLAPSVENRIITHISAIRKVFAVLPVTKIRIETAEFDIHRIKNPEVQGMDYQYGEKYGHVNTRNYILWRDNHTCRICGCRSGKLCVVSDNGSTEAPEHLRTLCKDCTESYSKGLISFTKSKRRFTAATQMGIMRDTLVCRIRKEFPVPVEQTCGYITKGIREDYDIPKSHINDAYCIAHNLRAKRCGDSYLYKKVRCHNRQLHKATVSEGNIRKDNQAPYDVKGFRLFDTVLYKGSPYVIFGRRTSGYFDIRTLCGNRINNGSVNCKYLQFISYGSGLLVERI